MADVIDNKSKVKCVACDGKGWEFDINEEGRFSRYLCAECNWTEFVEISGTVQVQDSSDREHARAER